MLGNLGGRVEQINSPGSNSEVEAFIHGEVMPVTVESAKTAP